MNDTHADMLAVSLEEISKLERALRGCQSVLRSRGELEHVVEWIQRVLEGADPSDVLTKKDL